MLILAIKVNKNTFEITKHYLFESKQLSTFRHQYQLLRHLQVQHRLSVGGHHRNGARSVHTTGVRESRIQGGRDVVRQQFGSL